MKNVPAWNPLSGIRGGLQCGLFLAASLFLIEVGLGIPVVQVVRDFWAHYMAATGPSV